MPDWISHILMGLAAAEIFSIDKKGLVVLGSLLPDFVVKINLLSAFFHMSDGLLFIARLYHSPVMGLIIPALIAPIFKYDWKKTYITIALGFMLHLFADSFTRQYYNGILLYPLSTGFFSFNIFWPEQYWIMLILSAGFYASVKLTRYMFSSKSSS
ncbi:metal-dependent hydrolase [Candidatus Woesearchaeota archaeon]|nr:metal-dependent hydrolase [Candidatus Woesearchaeota archaeon]